MSLPAGNSTNFEYSTLQEVRLQSPAELSMILGMRTRPPSGFKSVEPTGQFDGSMDRITSRGCG